MVKIYGIVEQANLTLMLSPPGADSRIKENHSDLLKIVRKIKGVDVGLGTCRDFAQIPGNRHFAKPLIYQDLEKRLQPQNHIP
jgi:hypothetical protein